MFKDVQYEELENYIDFAGVILVVIGTNLKIKYINEYGAKLLRCKKTDLIGKNWFDKFIPESNRQELKNLFKQLLTGNIEPYQYYINPIITADGEELIVRWHNSVLKDKKGDIKGILSSGSDITELSQVYDTIKFERKQLFSIFDSIEEAIYVTDPETYEIIFVNRYLINLLGKDPTGSLCYKEFQGYDKPCDFCTNRIIKELNGEPYKWQYYNPMLGRYYDITDRIILWPDGRKVRFELAIDITEKRRLEEQLMLEKEFFSQLFMNSPEAIAIADKDGRIDFVNGQFTRLFGYKEEEIKGKCIDDLIVPILYINEAKSLTERVSKGETISVESIRQTKEGKEIDVSILCHPIIIDNQIVRVYGIYRDISERKKAERELNKRLKDLEDFYDLAIGREKKIIELKEEIEKLRKELDKYKS